MTWTIYGDYGTGAFCCEAALAEAGADYVFEQISLRDDVQRQPAFRAINPSGKVPALRLPDGAILTESVAILLTIADHFPAAGLLPPSRSAAHAQALRWLAFIATEIYSMVEISDYPERFAPAGEEAAALKAKAQERARERLVDAEKAAIGPWFLGEAFSVVDLYVANFIEWRGTLGKDWLAGGPVAKLQSIGREVSQRPRAGAVWARHFGPR
jgi:GST-like protein